MAERFPLIANASTGQIQELPAGDVLNLTGNGMNISGVTTFADGATVNFSGTDINSGSRGDILVYNASGNLTKLTIGTTGKVLKSNGTDLVYGDSGGATNVYYVTTSGQDASGRGGSVDTAWRTIKYACSQIGTPTETAPAVIFVKAGLYEEVQLPIVVPPHTTIAGDSLRATVVKPGAGNDSGGSVLNTRSTLFRCSNGTIFQDMVLDGMGGYTPGSPAYKPENGTVGGVYFALNAASVVSTKSPYIYNITSFGNGATGALIDGSLHSSGNRSMLFHTYTAIHSDGLGIWAKNNSNAELISTFTYYCQIGLSVTGGSKMRSLNSSSAYGEYGVYSAGFDTSETTNDGAVKGIMLVYTNTLTTSFQDGEQVTGGTSGATAYVVNVQAEPKRIYIVGKSGTFQSNETVTGGTSGATATMTSGTAQVNQSGRVLVTTFSSIPDAGDSIEFSSTDGNAYQLQSVSSVVANSVTYRVLVFSTSRATAVAENVTVKARKEFSLARLTGHDFLQVGTGGTDTTNWPNNPTQTPAQADQIVTNETDPGRVYYTATDESGNFYVGDQFKVDQATGNVTLDASAFNLSGLESLRLGSVGGLIGASINEFSTDAALSQNSNNKVPTQAAVKGYVDSISSATPTGGTFTVAGIQTVTGTTLFTKQLGVSGVSTFVGAIDVDGHTELDNVNVSGALTATSANISGNMSVGGVLTYEDVTNVDSVGLITARSGIKVGSGVTIESNGQATFTGIVTFGSNSTTIGDNVINVGTALTLGHTQGLQFHTQNLHSQGFEINQINASGIVTASSFSGSVASSNLTGTIPTARLGSGTANSSTFLRGDSTFAVVDTALVADTSPQLGGNLDVNSKNIKFGDSGSSNDDRLQIGASTFGDMELFHDGTNSYITNITNDLLIQNSGDDIYIDAADDIFIRTSTNEDAIKCLGDGAVEIYHNGSKKAETVSGGFTISGTCTATAFSGDGSGLSGVAAFAAGTRMLFQQTSAPTGWTKVTSGVENKALRITTGTVGSGGSNNFTSVLNNTVSSGGSGSISAHTLSESEMPQHRHRVDTYNEFGNRYSNWATEGGYRQAHAHGTRRPPWTQNVGSSNSHTHSFSFSAGTFNLNVQYEDVIIAAKN